MQIFKKSKIHHNYKKESIKEKCQKMREEISLNLYYINRAQQKLSGSKLVYVTKLLKKNNETLYSKINTLKCYGRENIHLTIEPK